MTNIFKQIRENEEILQRYTYAYLLTPPLRQDMTRGKFKFDSFHSPTLVASPKLKNSLPYNLNKTGRRINIFIPF